MTAPIRPVVVEQKGLGQALQENAAPLLQALVQRRTFQEQQRQFNERQGFMEEQLAQQAANQQRSRAAEFLLQGISQDANFAKTDMAQQLEGAAGLRGFSAAITSANQTTERQQTKELEALFQPGTDTEPAGVFADLSPETQRFLRARFALIQKNIQLPATVEQRLADQIGVPPSELEKVESELNRLNIAEKRGRVAQFTRRNTVGNQVQVAVQGLGIEQERARELSRAGVDFIGIFERASDNSTGSGSPASKVVSTALQLLNASKDIAGVPQLLPAQALQSARDLLASVDPGQFNQVNLQGAAESQVNTMNAVLQQIGTFRTSGNRATVDREGNLILPGEAAPDDARERRLSEQDYRKALRRRIVSLMSEDERGTILPLLDTMLELAFQQRPRQ